MRVESKCFESTLKELLCYFTVLVKMIHAHYKQFRQHQESTKKKGAFQIPPTRTDHGPTMAFFSLLPLWCPGRTGAGFCSLINVCWPQPDWLVNRGMLQFCPSPPTSDSFINPIKSCRCLYTSWACLSLFSSGKLKPGWKAGYTLLTSIKHY